MALSRPQAEQIEFVPQMGLVATNVQAAVLEVLSTLSAPNAQLQSALTSISAIISNYLSKSEQYSDPAWIASLSGAKLTAQSITTDKFSTTAKAPYASAADTASTATTQAAGDNSTKVATTAFVTNASIGWNQTWVNVTANRALGTTYTNSTGKPIYIVVIPQDAVGSTSTISVTVGGIVIVNNHTFTSTTGPIAFIVPNLQTYKVTVTGTGYVSQWNELK